MAKVIDNKGFALVDYPDIEVMENQSDSTATTVAGLVTNFNALLKKLQDAGYMAKGE